MNNLERSFFADKLFDQLLTRFAKNQIEKLQKEYSSQKIIFQSWDSDKKFIYLQYMIDDKKVVIKYDINNIFFYCY